MVKRLGRMRVRLCFSSLVTEQPHFRACHSLSLYQIESTITTTVGLGYERSHVDIPPPR